MSIDVFLAGVSMTAFGKRPGDSVKSLTAEAVADALSDAGASVADIEAAWFSNTRQPMLEGQNTVRGQIALRPLGLLPTMRRRYAEAESRRMEAHALRNS